MNLVSMLGSKRGNRKLFNHFAVSHFCNERHTLNGQKVRQEEHDILQTLWAAHPHFKGKDVRELRLRLLAANEKICLAEGKEKERAAQVILSKLIIKLAGNRHFLPLVVAA